MKSTVRLLLLAALGMRIAACTSQPIKDCARLAGPGWTSTTPPANAAGLLQLENVPGGPGVFWFSNQEGHVLACLYGSGLINPSCGGSTAYEFALSNGHWGSRNLRSDVCPIDADQ